MALVVIFSLLTSAAFAVDSDSTNSSSQTQAPPLFVYKALLDQFGISENSKAAKRLKLALMKREHSPSEFEPKSEKVLFRAKNDSGLAHTEMNNDQLIASTRQRIADAKVRLSARKEEMIKARAGKLPLFSDKAVSRLSALFRSKEIPTCQKAKTKQYPLRAASEMQNKMFQASLKKAAKKRGKEGKGKGQGFIDILILPESASDSLLEQYYGPNTFVRRFKAGSQDTISLQASHAGIKCLPYRVRIHGDKKFIHHGSDALKTFSGRKGKFDKEVKRRLHEISH